jgi:hypothetical protein
MRREYAVADTPKARIAIAAKGAFVLYAQQNQRNFAENPEFYIKNPGAVSPPIEFLETFLEPFVEREAQEIIIGVRNKRVKDSMRPEREEIEQLKALQLACSKKMALVPVIE